MGTLASNSLQGNAGNDVLLGGPGSDVMLGGNDNDNLVWSNGDGSDVIDGEAGTDIVSVNGSVGTGDDFTVTNCWFPSCLRSDQLGTIYIGYRYDERLIVNGVGGDDSLTSSAMSGVAT